MKKFLFVPIFTVLALFYTSALHSQTQDLTPSGLFATDSEFPENYEVRKQMRETVFAPAGHVMNTRARIFYDRFADHRVFFQVKKNSEYFYLLFTNEKDYKFPLFSTGSYIIKRNRDDGRFVQVKIFIRNDPGCFVRIFPNGDRATMNMFLYGTPVYRNIPIPRQFEELLTAPFAEIMELTKNSVDWELIFTPSYTRGNNDVHTMVEKIREKLDRLQDRDDGAMNADGSFVSIEDLSAQDEWGFNCSGFAKWIADGVSVVLKDRYLDIEELKVKHTALRGNRWSERYEDKRDPYFGLDWTRNIAMILGNRSHPEAADIRKVQFIEYIEDVGYPMDKLHLILYLSAHEHPGRFYLGSINSDFGNDPVLRQHYHVVTLFPYFNDDGQFQVAVFERNREASIDELLKRYEQEYIHLVSISALPEFHLPPLPPSIEG